MSDSSHLPVRCLCGQWQVLISEPSVNAWVNVENEGEAVLLSGARDLWEDTINRRVKSQEVALKLFNTADIIERHLGSCMAARICRRTGLKASE